MQQEELLVNGLKASSGSYDLEGITAEMITKIARGVRIEPTALRDAKVLHTLQQAKADHFGVAEGIDRDDLSQTGWGVIFPADLPQKAVDAIKEALNPLFNLRRSQAAAQSEIYYREVIGPQLGYRAGETKNDFLKRFGRGPGPADPEKFPYYTLIVGSPETIPFSFQSQLDVQYGVGRIYFDKLEDYYKYAKAVVEAETKAFSRGRKATFFCPVHQDDKVTQIGFDAQIRPWIDQIKREYLEWSVNLLSGEDATKAGLSRLLEGENSPSLLFAAAHGLVFDPSDPHLLRQQGALVCQDWTGPSSRVPISENSFFSGDDITREMDVFGMLAFIQASYSGGTPKTDGFYRQAFGASKEIAPYSFLSNLPIKLLSHGALGAFVYVDRYWGASLVGENSYRRVEILDALLGSLLRGKPAGSAMDIISGYYAEVSIMLTEELDNTTPEIQNEVKIAELWSGSADNRSLSFLGDPAVRLAVSDKETPKAEREHLASLVSQIPEVVSKSAVTFQPDIVERVLAEEVVSARGSSEDLLGQPGASGVTSPMGVTLLAGFSADVEHGQDRLGITPDVDAFSKVIASKKIEPPLCIGLFGDWGSGKSFFMNKMRDRITYLSKNANAYEKAGNPTSYCSSVVQITFNAWHYVDADLWASLISHIFDSLADFIAKEERTTQRAVLFKELQSAKQLLAEAKDAKAQAEDERNSAQNQLEELQRNREEKLIDLKRVRVELFRQALNNEQNAEVKKALEGVSKELGVHSVIETAEDVQRIIQEFGSVRGRLQALLLALTNAPERWWRISLFLAILLLIPFLPALINYLASLGGVQNVLGTVGATITQASAFIASISLGIGSLLSKTSKVVGDLEKAKGKVETILKNSRAKPGTDELQLLQEISGLKEREEAAKKLLVEAQQRFDQAQAEIDALENIKDNRKLAQLVRERITSEDYKKRLGIISMIRSDLKSLSDFLTIQKQQPNNIVEGMPRIDRIVLYIDDLDRCPEERVVGVLQAIHLLLAFKLFVVVVGVDSRWLLHSMKKAYPALADDQQDSSLIDEEKLAWATTPQNYLEKIFQIPYNLQVMDKIGYEKLITSIVHPEGDKKIPESAPLPGKDDLGQANLKPGAEKENSDKKPADSADESNEKQAINEAILFGFDQPAVDESYGGIFDDQTPELLVISDDEEDFFKQLYALAPTPRSAKRMVNIYRLIRAKLPVTDLPVFLGDKKTPGEFKAVLTLLAVLTGFQNEAPYFFRQVNHADDRIPWPEILETILPRRKSTETESYYNDVLPEISKADAVAWRRLYFALKGIYKLGQVPTEAKPYRKWAQQVARFSFLLGKAFIYYGLPAEVKIVSINTGALNKADECVVIENFGDNEQDLTGWRLQDQEKHEFVFPAFILPPQMRVTVWSKAGQNKPTELFWGRKDSVWNNMGDNAYLYDKSNVLISNLRV